MTPLPKRGSCCPRSGAYVHDAIELSCTATQRGSDLGLLRRGPHLGAVPSARDTEGLPLRLVPASSTISATPYLRTSWWVVLGTRSRAGTRMTADGSPMRGLGAFAWDEVPCETPSRQESGSSTRAAASRRTCYHRGHRSTTKSVHFRGGDS